MPSVSSRAKASASVLPIRQAHGLPIAPSSLDNSALTRRGEGERFMRYLLAMILAFAACAPAVRAVEAMSDADFIKDEYIGNLKEHAVAGMAEAKSGDV